MRLPERLARRLRLTRFAAGLEALWHGLAAAAVIAVGFAGLALLDILPELGGVAHLAVLALLVLAFTVALARGIGRLAWPSDGHIRRRMERAIDDGGHRPIAALQDELSDARDPVARALWRRHQERMRERALRLRPVWPRPHAALGDPYGLRIVAFLLLFAGLLTPAASWPDRLQRAFLPDFSGPPSAPPHLDAWINPPEYTGVAPINLAVAPPDEVLTVPAGSRIIARLFGGRGLARLEHAGGSEPFERVDAENQAIERPLDADGSLAVAGGDGELGRWRIDVVADRIPTAEFFEDPVATRRGTLRLAYRASDDYGLADLQLEIAPTEDMLDEEPLGLPLSYPEFESTEVESVVFRDLTAHPWAGLKVTLTLKARDAIDQEGASPPFAMVMPERIFNHPVARALIEQRKILTRTPERHRSVALALEGLSRAPELFDHDITVFLGLRTATRRLRRPPDAEKKRDVQALMWDLALHIEDGNLSQAERELRLAQQELMDALTRKADDAEIRRLMDRLQQALDRFMEAMARRAVENARNEELMEIEPDANLLEGQDIQRMMDRARELAEMGATDAAREMLRQMQDLLENLKNDPVLAQRPSESEAGEMMRELSEMMREQRRLLDQSFQEQQAGRPGNRRFGGQRQGQMQQGQQSPRGQRGQRMQEGGRGQGSDDPQAGLSQDQESLRRRLGDLMRSLAENGQQIPGSLGRAERFMRDARDALRQGRTGEATGPQSNALDQLSEGLRTMAERMMQQMGEQGQDPNGEAGRLEDPLGRTMPSGGVNTDRVNIPDRSEMQKAREIFDELRRRSGERFRPQLELDYIDRLMRRF